MKSLFICFILIFFSLSTSNAQWIRTGTNVNLTTITDNVGIGITNPSAKLDVNGNILISQTGYFGFRRTSDGVAIPMLSVTQATNGLSNLQIGSGSGQFSGGNTDIFAGGTCKLKILGNGNVGIGTTSPSEMLHVLNGNIKASSNTHGFEQYVILSPNINTGGEQGEVPAILAPSITGLSFYSNSENTYIDLYAKEIICQQSKNT